MTCLFIYLFKSDLSSDRGFIISIIRMSANCDLVKMHGFLAFSADTTNVRNRGSGFTPFYVTDQSSHVSGLILCNQKYGQYRLTGRVTELTGFDEQRSKPKPPSLVVTRDFIRSIPQSRRSPRPNTADTLPGQ